ncbi:DUF924 family protein [Oricola sp.]|uniref:DUF924 family protein n=1 Tax=Oricola sp. TaxID=1979950 RepID=UPI003BACB92D
MSEEAWVGDVLDFWFEELEPKQWFVKDEALDATIIERFSELYETLAATDNDAISASPRQALAAVIVFDQFARNMFRGSPKTFACDPKALALAERLIADGSAEALSRDERYFLMMPFMHSEDLGAQERCVELFAAHGSDQGLKYAKLHRDVIERFGRFPHRNGMLGRETTPEEQAYLDDGGGF